MLRVPFLVMEVRPCGKGTNPLDQTIVGGGKPIARQRTDATELPGLLSTYREYG